ncbi:hypothetical protein J2Z76_002973 [Sedimentibacter acidaminivorans]|uniref:Carboxypeptidase regulatory-like domain-containing protein n=1 Tax=Sedimentibacter acidaminivorans TaxID=913099 RepID=A0ABS4GHC4_9FIRM|nr:carboxypeptidase-like regulatory domain-containing protein [Sedimentibacter acidaminivorans]MBP1927100.1 hypothetical protein [Sedimentibacter acidaminivorans]
MYNWNFPYLKYNYVNTCNALPETDSIIQPGFLDVIVFNEHMVPMENAVVTILILDRFTGEAPIQFGLTDAEGKSPHFSVPTTYVISNLTGQNINFTTYNVRVEYVGYYSAQTNNVRFYPGITTILTYPMNPIPIKIPGVNLEQIVNLPKPKFD